MSDERKSNPPPPRPGSGQAPSARKPSNAGLKAVSAARAQPLAPARTISREQIKKRLRSEAESSALNVLSIFKETWQDFRNSDRFFKYKAGIIALWAALSVSSFVVACPDSGVTNSIGAALIATDVSGRPVVSIQNASETRWEDVRIVVNGSYRTAIAIIDARQTVTLTPKQWVGPNGRTAPTDLKVTDVEVQTSEGNTVLLRGGQKR